MIPRAIDAAYGRATFQVFGEDYDTPDGTCLRDYIHVNDLAAAHLLALDALKKGAASTAYNLGNGRPTSVRDILTSVERVTGRRVPYTAGPRRDGDPPVLYSSSTRRAEPSSAGRRSSRTSRPSLKLPGNGASAIRRAIRRGKA